MSADQREICMVISPRPIFIMPV